MIVSRDSISGEMGEIYNLDGIIKFHMTQSQATMSDLIN